ncbi:MAG: hypothetical protein WCA84_09105 [Ignavibacteriaceae bacterium]
MKKSIKLLIFQFTFSLVLFTYVSCSNPAGPNNSIQPGSRNYTWTVDTIKTVDNLTFTSIWGVSPTDVWAAGYSSWPGTAIWHYNGSWWGADSEGINVYPWAIIGFSDNEVWLGNTNSTIWKYNGMQWQQYGVYNIDGYDNVLIQHLDGTASNYIFGVGAAEVYATGAYKGIILQYDGTSWKFVNIPNIKIGFADGRIDLNSGALILEGTVYDTTGWINKVHAWDGDQLKEIYSGYTYASVGSVQHEVLVSINQKIYKYMNGQLVLWKDFSNTDCIGKIWCGRSESDFFMCSSTGIGHYNGIDFETIYTKTNPDISGGFIFDKDVFIIMDEPNNPHINYMVHGKLK